MKIIFATQSRSAEMFFNIGKVLETEYGFESSVFLGSDSRWYREFTRTNPEFAERPFLSEWDVANKAANLQLNGDVLDSYEKKYGISLFQAAVCDRRLKTGWKSSFFQDYKPRLSDEEILKRLQAACLMIEEFFETQTPTHLVSFICVTYIEFIAILESQARGIPVRNFRPVRIKNYVTIDNGIYDPPRALQEKFDSVDYIPSEQAVKEAVNFMDSLSGKPMLYEGAVPIKKDLLPDSKNGTKERKENVVKQLIELLGAGNYKKDTHSSPRLISVLHKFLRKPFHDSYVKQYMKDRYVRKEELSNYKYTFFPLHLEPELALLLYAPAYLNQIEVIRTIAHALPANMKLIVKDHPLGYERRKVQFYKKLLDISKVLIADPKIYAKDMVDSSQMVTLIGGSIGIEALVRKKPVVVLSPCATYKLLNKSKMLKYVVDLNNISKEIMDLLANYEFDEQLLIRFLGTAIDTAQPLNLYSVLLRRKGVFTMAENSYKQEVNKAAKYLMECLEPQKQLV